MIYKWGVHKNYALTCCVSMFHITTEEPSFCTFSQANQTDANTGSLGTAAVLYGRERKHSSLSKQGQQIFIHKERLLGCLLASLHTLLINISVRPICARGDREGEEKKSCGHSTRSTDDPEDCEWVLTLRAALLPTLAPFGHKRGSWRKWMG